MAQEVLKQHDLTFSHRPHMSISDLLENPKPICKCKQNSICGEIIAGFSFLPNDSLWLKLRRILTSEMKSAKRRQQTQELRAEETSNLQKSILADIDEPFELYPKVLAMAVELLSRIILSHPFSSARKTYNTVELEEFTAVSHEVSHLLDPSTSAISSPG